MQQLSAEQSKLIQQNITGCGQSPWTTLKCDISVNSE